MDSILKATLILGSGSVASLLAGLVANKAYAVWVGPDGVGLLGLFQGLLGLAGLFAGMGLSSGLVRLGATPASQNEAVAVAALRIAAWQIYGMFSLAVALLLLLFGQPIARMLLADSPAWTVVLVIVAMLLGLAAGVQIGLLNAHHRVPMLAKVTAFSSIFGAVWGIGLVWVWREAALPWVLLGVPLAQLAIASFFARSLNLSASQPDPAKVREARAQLMRFGLPYTISQLLGSAVQLGMPFFVLHTLGQESVGFYRATVLFSTAYIGFLLTALGQDFYPRLSALRGQPVAFRQAIDHQQRFVLLLGGPLVVLSLALAPLVIAVLFSPEFKPAVAILNWQLVGDLLRFVSWTLGFAVLAGLPSRTYLLTETVGGGMLLGFSLWGMQQFGLQGLGIGWMLAYAGYAMVLTLLLSLRRVWMPTLSNLGLMLSSLLVVALVKVVFEPWALAVALLWGLVCGFLLVKQVLQSRAEMVKP
jgi:PST family polysaccharide transporter